MSKALIDNAVIDTDWFQELPCKYKTLYFVLRLTCSGVGFRTIGFRKLSQELGAEYSREEFNLHCGRFFTWVGDDEIWIYGRIAEQYGKLSPGNSAHVNMARQVIEKTADRVLSAEARAAADRCALVVKAAECGLTVEQLSTECLPTVKGESIESQATVGGGSSDPNITITIKNSSSSEGGVGETKAPASSDSFGQAAFVEKIRRSEQDLALELIMGDEPPPLPGPPGIIPALEGDYTAAARSLLEQVSHAAQEAWLGAFPDAAWIRQEIHKHVGHKATNVDRNPGRSPGAKIGSWLGVGWKIREQSRNPLGWANKTPELDLSKITGFTE